MTLIIPARPKPAADTGRAASRLRVASYNIRKTLGLDWRRDAARTVEVINELEADVVVLQEADRRLGERPATLPRLLLERETDFLVADLATNDVSLGWHGNAILVRRGLSIDRAERLALPSLEPRGAVAVRLRAGAGAAPVTVVGVHLALLRRWRRRQLEAIRRQVGEAPLARAVIAGDFNEWSPSLGLEALADGFRVIAPGKTFHSSRPVAGLDRIAHGRSIDALGAGVHRSPKARITSDHLPIWGDLCPQPG